MKSAIKGGGTQDERKVFQEEDLDRPVDWRLLRRLIVYTQPYAKHRNILLVLVVVRSVQLPVLAWMLASIINHTVQAASLSEIIWLTMGFLLFALFTEGCLRFRQLLALQLGESVIHDLRRDLFQHIARMPMSFFHQNKLGRILSRISSDAEALRTGVQDVLFISMVQGGQMIVCALLMIYYDWVLFLIVLGLVPVLWGLNRYFRRRLSRAHRSVQESFSKVTSALAEAVNGIRVTQGFVRQDVNTEAFQDLVAKHAKNNMRVAQASGLFLPLLELNSQIFLAGMLAVGGWQVLSGSHHVTIESLIQFFFLARLFFSPIQSLGNQYNQLLTSLAGAERVFLMLDTKPDWREPPSVRPLSQLRGAVAFENVHFSYTADRPALRGISFSVEPGQSVALVGHTGSGKSSVINLLTKFYLPDSGTVRIDGQDLRTIQGDSLHRHLGIVPQHNFLFSGSVLENIRFSQPTASEEEVIEAARQLEVLDLLLRLPHGLNTVVGEKGSGLSLGQRQVICFVRAMLANPRILILDEATSSIDTITEVRLQNALAALLHGRTSFLVAHRLSTVREADLILLLQQGQIVEQGNHASLLAENGIYARLYG